MNSSGLLKHETYKLSKFEFVRSNNWSRGCFYTRERERERRGGGMKSEVVYSPETTVLYMFNKTLIDLLSKKQ